MGRCTVSDKLESYVASAKAAIIEVTNGEIGVGEDPLGFVIAAFVSQATVIKEKIKKIDELRGTIKNGDCRFHCRSKSQHKRIAIENRSGLDEGSTVSMV